MPCGRPRVPEVQATPSGAFKATFCTSQGEEDRPVESVSRDDKGRTGKHPSGLAAVATASQWGAHNLLL